MKTALRTPGFLFIIAALHSASALAALPASTEAKLQKHWKAYETARALLVEKTKEGSTISRAEWEKILSPASAADKLTASDLKAIEKEQTLTIEKAKKKAKSASTKIKLDQVRANKKAREFCEQIPKGGMLHIHPWGTADRATVRAILAKVNPKIDRIELEKKLADKVALAQGKALATILPDNFDFLGSYPAVVKYSDLRAQDQDALIDLFFLSSDTSHSFERFLGVFDLLSALFFQNYAAKPDEILWDGFFARSQKLNIKYVEVSHNASPKEATLTNWEKWAQNAKKYGIEAKAIAAFNRMSDTEEKKKKNADTMAAILNFKVSPTLVGINLVADEGKFPMFEHAQDIYGQLLVAQQEGKTQLQATVHAGELGDVTNLRDSIIFGVKRIGHAVNLMKDPVALEYAARNQIGVEANILSNERLGVWTDKSSHPFLKQQRLGLKVSFATDDEGIFETDLASECAAAITHTDIQYSELKQILRNSLETSFATEATKKKLLSAFDKDIKAFETKWK